MSYAIPTRPADLGTSSFLVTVDGETSLVISTTKPQAVRALAKARNLGPCEVEHVSSPGYFLILPACGGRIGARVRNARPRS